MIGLLKIDAVADYCSAHRITAMDVRGFGGLRRIDVAMKAGTNDTLTRDQWSVVCSILERRAVPSPEPSGDTQ